MNNEMKKRLMQQISRTLVKCSGWLMLICWLAGFAEAQEKRIEDEVIKRAGPYEQMIASAAARQGIEPQLLIVVGWLETRFNPAAISKRGARGVMQFMPATAARYGLSDPHNPQAAIDAAARYLRDLAVRFDYRADLVLAAYNAGEATVEAYLKGQTVIVGSRIINPKGAVTRGIPPYRETRSYVARGMTLLKTLHSKPSSFTQQVGSKMKSDSGQEERGEPAQGLVRNSVRATNHSEPDTKQFQIRPNVHRRSIYFGR
ncbi:MAG: lytic transglycosylase domain-containing protein [Acidobacteria bacterium]|nr:lytic transglycosylase domain-containing protein [Acidobacteriota bacterium]